VETHTRELLQKVEVAFSPSFQNITLTAGGMTARKVITFQQSTSLQNCAASGKIKQRFELLFKSSLQDFYNSVLFVFREHSQAKRI